MSRMPGGKRIPFSLIFRSTQDVKDPILEGNGGDFLHFPIEKRTIPKKNKKNKKNSTSKVDRDGSKLEFVLITPIMRPVNMPPSMYYQIIYN